MRLLKLLLSSSIIYIATIAMEDPTDRKSYIVQCNELNFNLSDNICPLHYNIKLNFAHSLLLGEYVIIIYIKYATQFINFHVSDSIIKSISLPNMTLKQTHSGKIYESVIKTNYYDTNSICCYFNNILLPGIYNLHIWFYIPIDVVRESFRIPYINENGDKELLITGIQTRKQQLFPFWNKPKLRITFNISIKHHRNYTALSNMPIKELSEPLYNETWTYFNEFVNSIDNIVFVLFDFHRINLTDTISMWCRPQLIPYMKFASYIIKNITMYLRNYLENSKRFLEWTIVLSESKVDHIAIPNLQDEVKHILGFVFHRETDIMYNEELDSVTRKMIIASSVVRKMIQKYVGNLFNPFYWYHVWLNEGFIVFFQSYIIHETVLDFPMMDLFIVQIQHELLDLNTYVNFSFPEDDIYGNYLYTFFSRGKGSIIWLMLERTLSHSIFSKVIQIYLNKHAKPLETTSDNLWNVMETIVHDYDYTYQFNIKSLVYSWVMQKCFPILEVMRNYTYNIVTISAQFYNKLDEKQYYIPITYTMESESNFKVSWTNIWLTPSNPKIELFLKKDKSRKQWIIFNIQQAGYYRVNYDSENWRKIARYLNSEEYKNIHVLNRAQIIDDAFHFAREKQLDFSIFWELTNYLRKEKDYIAWYPMIKAFEFMSNIFVLLKFYPEFQEKLNLGFIAWRLELDLWSNENNIDDSFECLRQELMKWNCIIYDVSCNIKSVQMLQWHLNNTEHKFMPGQKRWTYCNGLRRADTLWHTVFELQFNYTKQMDRTIFECLAYSENSKIIINYLEKKFLEIYAYYFFKPPSDQVNSLKALMVNIFLSTIARNAKLMLKDILNNFEKIKCRFVSKIATLIVIINNVYSEEQLDEIYAFIRNEIKESRYPVEALDYFEDKLTTRWLEINRQIKYFQSLFSFD